MITIQNSKTFTDPHNSYQAKSFGLFVPLCILFSQIRIFVISNKHDVTRESQSREKKIRRSRRLKNEKYFFLRSVTSTVDRSSSFRLEELYTLALQRELLVGKLTRIFRCRDTYVRRSLSESAITLPVYLTIFHPRWTKK